MLVMRCCPITGAVHYLYVILAILVLLVLLAILVRNTFITCTVLPVMLAIVVKLTELTIQYKQLFPIGFLYVTKMVLNCSCVGRR